MTAVSPLEQHQQPTAVVAADLFTDSTSVLRGDIDHDHIGRRDPLGQLGRRVNRLQLAFLPKQQAQPDLQLPAPGDQGHILWHGCPLTALCWSTT